MSSKGRGFKVIKYAGLTLGGGKGRKTCLSILEYYVKEKKLFLSELHENIQETAKVSADTLIIKILEQNKKNLKLVALDAPLMMPKCIRCRLKCPGHEKCQEPEIRWMWKQHKKRAPSKRPNKIFTPYTERCVEQYVASEFHQDLASDHALGSNRAPLAARAQYLKRRIPKAKVIEVMPRVSVWHKQLNWGPEIRQQYLDQWSEEGLSFIYHRDFKLMVKDAFAFESFICAYTAFLSDRGRCLKRPKNFPKAESWVAIPEST